MKTKNANASHSRKLIVSKRKAEIAKVEPQLTEHPLFALSRALGLRDGKLTARLIDHADQIQSPWALGDRSTGMDTAMTMILELRPTSLTELLLAVLIVGTYHSAVSFFRAAAVPSRPELQDANLARAERQMRLFSDQIALYAKLTRNGTGPRMNVENLNVNDGGQAIIGPVAAARRKKSV
jgi:hypothetical protein